MPVHIGLGYDRARLFVLIPQSLGYLGKLRLVLKLSNHSILFFIALPQIWSLLYFTCAISIIVSNLITHIYTLHSSLADMYPSAKRYQNYLILGYCAFSCIFTLSILGEVRWQFCCRKNLSSCFIFKGNSKFIDYFISSILTMLELINISCLSIVVFWIYGVRRLSDDICFTFGVQPTKFWKITWYVMPFITTVRETYNFSYLVSMRIIYYLFQLAAYYEHNYRFSRRSIVSTTTANLLIIVCACPIPILVFVEIFIHMKQRVRINMLNNFLMVKYWIFVYPQNLTGLLRPTYMWGPPDPEERHRRFSFNPRKETTYTSKIGGCKHNCLLHSKVRYSHVLYGKISFLKFMQVLKSLMEPEAQCTEEYLANVRAKQKISVKY